MDANAADSGGHNGFEKVMSKEKSRNSTPVRIHWR
jgi:hypothetical protein